MKTVRKEFWVSSNYLECIRANGSGYLELASDKCIHKISITYEIPERKVEISESDFEEKLRKSVPINWTDELIEEISKRFFGDK